MSAVVELHAPPLTAWWRDALRRFARNRAAVFGAATIGLFAFIALLAPWIDHHPPERQYNSERVGVAQDGKALFEDNASEGPTRRFWLGTDRLSRDQWSRLVHGARVSLAVGVFTQVFALGLGLSIGMAAGLGGRWADSLLMRMTDVAYAFPDLLLIILLVAIFGVSVPMMILAIGLVSWATLARLVRAQVLTLQNEEYVLAARALGASTWRIAWRHLLPNLAGPVVVTATFGIPAAIFAEAALSFLGLGLPPPTPSWGRMIADSKDVYAPAFVLITSCAAVAITMMSFSFIGDGLRDALDPRTYRGRPRRIDAGTKHATPASLEQRKAA